MISEALVALIKTKQTELKSAIDKNDYQKVMIIKLSLRHLYNQLLELGLK